MSNVVEYRNIVAFHPGYYIKDIIEATEISKTEFADRLGIPERTLNLLINGHISVSNDLANKLSKLLGTSPEIWLRLQQEYDKKINIIQHQEREMI